MSGDHSDLALPTFREVAEAFFAMSKAEFGMLLGVACWLAVLIIPLAKIDRRDRFAQAGYAAYMAASGVMLTVAANRLLLTAKEIILAFALAIAFGCVAAGRWVVDAGQRRAAQAAAKRAQANVGQVFTQTQKPGPPSAA